MANAKTFLLITQYCGHMIVGVVRWLLWLTAGLLLLGLALLLVLRLYVLPHLSDWRPEIASALSQHWALDVQIADIAVESSAVLPSISLSQVQIRDPAKQETQLLIPYVQVRFSVAALLRLGLAEILVRDMEVLVQRQGPTQWTVAGFVVDTAKPANPYALDRVFANRSVQVQNATLYYLDNTAGNGGAKSGAKVKTKPIKTKETPENNAFTPPKMSNVGEDWTARELFFSMRNTRNQHRFELAAILPFASEKPIQIKGDLSNGPLVLHSSDWTNWSGNIHVNAAQLDLAAVNQHFGLLASPLSQASLGVVADIQIRGGQWQLAKGQLTQLIYSPYAAGVAFDASKGLKIPGIGNADIDFEIQPEQGEVSLKLKRGWVALPGFLAEAKVPLDTLKATIAWQKKQGKWRVKAKQIQLQNSDLALQGMVEWESGVVAQAQPSKTKNWAKNSHIHVALKLPHVKAQRAYRYLPLGISEKVRQYLQEALSEGHLDETTIHIQGPLANIPFIDGSKGSFRMAGKVRDGRFVYIPSYLQRAGSKAWPALEQLSATWEVNKASLQVSKVQARLAKTAIQPVLLDASIPNVYDPVLSVHFETQGALPNVLATVRKSALSDLLGSEILLGMQASGDARYRFAIKTPLQHPGATEVQGQIALLGNDIKIDEGIPWLRKLEGNLLLSEKGFSIAQAQAQALGGPIQFQAELAPVLAPVNEFNKKARSAAAVRPPLVFQASGKGRLTSKALSEASELRLLSNLAKYLQGSADYSLKLRFEQGQSEVEFASDLAGMVSTLPEPFAKAAQARLPLLFQVKPKESIDGMNGQNKDANSPKALLDHMDLSLGDKGQVARIRYTRDWSQGVVRAVQGNIAIGLDGSESPPISARGVGANIKIQHIDLNAWLGVLNQLSPAKAKSREPASLTSNEKTPKQNALQSAALSFLPDVLALRSENLYFDDYTLSHLVVGGRRNQNNWTVTLSADEAKGFASYSQTDTDKFPSIEARFPYLYLDREGANGVQQSLEEGGPSSLPNIDLVIDDLRVGSLHLGALALQAQNTSDVLPENFERQAAQTKTPIKPIATSEKDKLWRIQNLSLMLPEASLKVKGSWRLTPRATLEAVPTDQEQGRTRILFEIKTSSLGGMLSRLHLPNVVGKGAGTLNGELTWGGAPTQVNYADLDGRMRVDLRQGSLLQIDPGAARLLGLFSLQFLPRLLTSDVDSTFGKGFVFDTIKGSIVLNKGVGQTQKLEIRNGELANVAISGSTNLVTQTQDLNVVVAPEIDFSGAALAAGVINPALLIFLPVQWLAAKFLEDSNIKLYHVTGHWSKPVITEEEMPPVENQSKPQ